MAGVSGRTRAGLVVLAAALAAQPVAGQQTVVPPAHVPPPQNRIESAPLPPIGGDTAAGRSADAPARERLPQPRFLRAPSADGELVPDANAGAGEATDRWQSSPDGRFHRAPERDREQAQDPAPAPIVPIDPPQTDLRAGARLRELDKMTGQTKTFEIGVGEEREIDRLRIRLEACRSPEANDVHGTMAFLKIWDTKRPGSDEAFSGWMFAESPALSALDHPRYDLWVISCTTSAVEASASSE
jgi:hypothetical protein